MCISKSLKTIRVVCLPKLMCLSYLVMLRILGTSMQVAHTKFVAMHIEAIQRVTGLITLITRALLRQLLAESMCARLRRPPRCILNGLGCRQPPLTTFSMRQKRTTLTSRMPLILSLAFLLLVMRRQASNPVSDISSE